MGIGKDQWEYYVDPTRPPGPDGQGGFNIHSESARPEDEGPKDYDPDDQGPINDPNRDYGGDYADEDAMNDGVGFTAGGERAVQANHGELRRDYVTNVELNDRDRAARNPERHRRQRAMREFDRTYNSFANEIGGEGVDMTPLTTEDGPEADGPAGSGHFQGSRELTVDEWNALQEQIRTAREARQGGGARNSFGAI